MDILKFLFILTLVAFPLGEFGRYLFPSMGNAPLLVNDVLIGITVGTWVLKKIWNKEKIAGSLVLPVVLFLGVCVVSLVVNSTVLTPPQLFIASLYILRWGIYAGIYFVVKEFDTKFKEKVIILLLIVAQITVGIGYAQYFFYPGLRSLYHLGWDEHLYRMFSVFLDPNFAGVIISLICIFTAGIALQKLHEKRYMYAYVVLIFAFLDFVAVYLTYSRSALLMLLVSGVVFLWLHGKMKYVFAGFFLFLAILFLAPKSFQTEGTNIFRLTSSEARLESGKNALDIFTKHPIVGVGFNAYRYAQNKYGYISGRFWVVSHAGAGTDNSFLFVLATTGIIGFLLFGFLWYRIFRLETGQLRKKEYHSLAIVTITSIIGVFVSSLFINSLFYVFIMEWLWILIGLSSSEEKS